MDGWVLVAFVSIAVGLLAALVPLSRMLQADAALRAFAHRHRLAIVSFSGWGKHRNIKLDCEFARHMMESGGGLMVRHQLLGKLEGRDLSIFDTVLGPLPLKLPSRAATIDVGNYLIVQVNLSRLWTPVLVQANDKHNQLKLGRGHRLWGLAKVDQLTKLPHAMSGRFTGWAKPGRETDKWQVLSRLAPVFAEPFSEPLNVEIKGSLLTLYTWYNLSDAADELEELRESAARLVRLFESNLK